MQILLLQYTVETRRLNSNSRHCYTTRTHKHAFHFLHLYFQIWLCDLKYVYLDFIENVLLLYNKMRQCDFI